MAKNSLYKYDIFIAYHGTFSEHGSYWAAKCVSDALTKAGFTTYLHQYSFLMEDRDVSFCDTYRIIKKSALFLLICNDYIPRDEDGFIAEKVGDYSAQLKQELDEFQRLCDSSERNKQAFNCVYFGTKVGSGADRFCIDLFPKLMGGHNNLLIAQNTDTDIVNWCNVRLGAKNSIEPVSQLYFDLSDKFLYEEYVNCPQYLYDRDIEIISERIKPTCEDDVVAQCKENVITYVYQQLKSLESTKNLLKIYGAQGLNKSRFMQLLFLTYKINYSEHNFEPFYINLSNYEKLATQEDFSKTCQSLIQRDINDIDAIGSRSHRKVLLFIDGLKDYKTNPVDLGTMFYNYLAQRIKNYAQIVSINTEFVDNPARKITNLYQLTCRYTYEMHFEAVSMHKREKCLRYLSTFFSKDQTEQAYKRLNALRFMEIDSFIISIAQNYISEDFQGYSIIDIYAALLENIVFDAGIIDHLAEIAYQYMFTNQTIREQIIDTYYIWEILCKHKTILHYLISFGYTKKMRNQIINDTTDLSEYEVIMPKEITRFIMPAINADPSLEVKVIEIAKQYYRMGTHGKSRVTFLLGRIRGKEKPTAIAMLTEFCQTLMREIAIKDAKSRLKMIDYNYSERKNDMFLLRSIMVSLIYYDQYDVMIEYIEMLITDELANKINRGFHLEYYGDKKYQPMVSSSLDFEDDYNVGENTLKILCNYAMYDMQKRETPHIAVLEVFTICSLLQARIAAKPTKYLEEYEEYVQKCVQIVEIFVDRYGSLTNCIDCYFKMILKDFKEYLDKRSAQGLLPPAYYKTFAKSNNIKRAGWAIQHIPDPEDITDHMYNCWLFATMNLPETYDDPDYNKAQIAKMLQIHDLAETVLGDIPKYDKLSMPRYADYNNTENMVMMTFLLRYTYGFTYNMCEYLLAWDEWFQMKSINALIAKDIDTIQAIYTFGVYYNAYPDLFDKNCTINWLNESRYVKTELGKSMLCTFVTDNPEFKELMALKMQIDEE